MVNADGPGVNASPGGARPIRLAGFPAVLFAAAHEQWEALLREYSLRGMGGTQQSFAHEEVNRGRQALNVLADAAEDAGGAEADLAVLVDHAGDFAVLQAVLHDARRLSLAGELLTVPTLPEIAALRNWVCEEVPAQAAGAEPTAWRAGLIHDDPDDPPAAQWDATVVPGSHVAWVLGDDHNRIVDASPPALSLLGWGSELVGQRLLAIIPQELREAHIAGFMRSVVSGEGALFDTPLALPALRADGSQVPIWLTLTRHQAHRGRHVYLGVLAARETT